MATMRRRIIYLPDDEWERLRAEARAAGVTISELIRRRLGPIGKPSAGPNEPERSSRAATPAPRPPTGVLGSQAARDAVLRRMARQAATT